MLTAKDVFEKTRDAALGATDQDEKPLQVDYSALEGKMEPTIPAFCVRTQGNRT